MKWLKGLIVALMMGAANGFLVVMTDPVTFDFETGWKRLGSVTLMTALMTGATYLKNPPK